VLENEGTLKRFRFLGKRSIDEFLRKRATFERGSVSAQD